MEPSVCTDVVQMYSVDVKFQIHDGFVANNVEHFSLSVHCAYFLVRQ